MFDNRSIVFIVGAGGSFPYNFPLGTDLYELIRDKYSFHVNSFFNNADYISGHLAYIPSQAENFCEALKTTSAISIDKYLNINKVFKEQGLISIVAQIYISEQNSILPTNNKVQNDWLTYLYQKLIQGLNTPEEILNFSQNRISFITFNYDRSLEHFLYENLCGLVKNANISRKQVADEFNKIPIIHVYGKVGFLPWQKEIYHEKPFVDPKSQVLSYGVKNYKPISIALDFKSSIEVMYDERKDNDIIIKAQKLIKDADNIFFLGFGYDEKNLEILKLPELLKNKVVYGTVYKSTDREIHHIKSLLRFSDLDSSSGFYAYDNLMLLRENLI